MRVQQSRSASQAPGQHAETHRTPIKAFLDGRRQDARQPLATLRDGSIQADPSGLSKGIPGVFVTRCHGDSACFETTPGEIGGLVERRQLLIREARRLRQDRLRQLVIQAGWVELTQAAYAPHGRYLNEQRAD
jgi:hypothetical protein